MPTQPPIGEPELANADRLNVAPQQGDVGPAATNLIAPDSASTPSAPASTTTPVASPPPTPPATPPVDEENWKLRLARYENEKLVRQREARRAGANMILLTFALAFFTLAFYFASRENPDIYTVDKETLRYVNRAFNAGVLLLIPFLLGAIGGFTRLLISGLTIADHMGLMLASGLVSAFSWVSIKSGVLMKIVAPHLSEHGIQPAPNPSFEAEFYTMALVAILVGMFSSNVYIFVNEKVERLLSKTKADSKVPG